MEYLRNPIGISEVTWEKELHFSMGTLVNCLFQWEILFFSKGSIVPKKTCFAS